MLQSFPHEVIDKLKTYVYRLIDPRNGETFYVGKDAPNSIWKIYVGKRLPDEYRKPGAANPIKYTYR